MSNNHEIKTIVAELQSMSPRTQLEIVRLCKRVAELTPDYIEQLSREDLATFSALLETAKTNLQNEIDAVDTRLTTEVNAIDSELTEINNAIELLQNRINDCENDIDDEVNDRAALINKNQTTNATNIVNESSDINIEAHGSVNITGYDEIYAQDDNGHSLAIDASGFALNTNDHNLTFKNDGKLKIDGVEVGGGGGSQLYAHNIIISSGNDQIGLLLINSVSRAYNNITDLTVFLTGYGKIIMASGFISGHSVCYLKVESARLYAYHTNSSGTITSSNLSSYSISDNVATL